MSEGLAQDPYVATRVGFEPATLRMQGTELTTEPPPHTALLTSVAEVASIASVRI